MASIELVHGDITEQMVDVVVNAANLSLLGGGGVDTPIHRKGGPVILAERRELRASHNGRSLDTDQALMRFVLFDDRTRHAFTSAAALL